MEKYGVQIDDTNDKTASKDRTCPKCGEPVDPESSVPKCRTHGTQPFEERK